MYYENGYRGRINDDFVMLCKRFADRTSEECSIVPCSILFPDYHMLSLMQAEFYFYWRQELLEGRCHRADVGYLNLFAAESVAIGRSPSVLLECLRCVDESGFFTPAAVFTLVSDTCIKFSLPYPDWAEILHHHHPEFYRSYVLASPLSFRKDLSDIFQCYDRIQTDDERLFNLVLNYALREIDEYLVATTGKTLLATYSEGRKAEIYNPFEPYPLQSDSPLVLEYEHLGKRFNTFMDGLTACIDHFFGFGCELPQKRGFPKEFARLVSALADHPGTLVPWDSQIKHPLPVKKACDGDVKGVLFPLKADKHLTLSPKFKTDIAEYRDISNDVPHPYVPSPGFRTQYRHLNPEQMAFYLYWRTCVRHGTFPGTDVGYLWLYVCEEINSPEPPEKVYAGLLEVVSAYSDGDVSAPGYYRKPDIANIRRACVDYAIYHDLDLAPDLPCETLLACTVRFKQFMEGRITCLDSDALVGLAGMSDSKAAIVTDDVAAITSSALRRLDCTLPGGIFKSCFVRNRVIKYDIFEDVLFYGRPSNSKKFQISVPLVYENKFFQSELADLLRETSVHVRAHLGQGRKKPSKHQVFGTEVRDILAEETVKRFTKEHAYQQLSLDSDLIDTAQKDLEYVVSVMSVDEDDEVCTVEKEQEEVSLPEGWKGFSDSLSSSQREYLLALLHGEDADAILRKYSTTSIRMVDSINDLAMDCIGDTLVEDGGLVPDYSEELRQAIGERPRS